RPIDCSHRSTRIPHVLCTNSPLAGLFLAVEVDRAGQSPVLGPHHVRQGNSTSPQMWRCLFLGKTALNDWMSPLLRAVVLSPFLLPSVGYHEVHEAAKKSQL